MRGLLVADLRVARMSDVPAEGFDPQFAARIPDEGIYQPMMKDYAACGL